MEYLFSTFAFSAAAGRVSQYDDSVISENQPNENISKNDTIFEQSEPKRKLPYFLNQNLDPTSTKPVFYGAHLNQNKEITFTAKFPDGKCYTMVPARRKKGVLPFLKNTKILNNRCQNRCPDGRKACHARYLTEWNLDAKILENLTDIDAILDMGKHFNN